MLKQSVEIINKLGPRARASSKFTQTASQFRCEVRVIKDGSRVNGKGITGPMMLTAAGGTAVELETGGADETAAMQASTNLISDCFGKGE